MTVYVDNMRASFGRMVMCHMIADTDDELHEMAFRIGVARRWYQGDHYDIALSKRALAVAAGAREITQRQLGLMVMNRRAGADKLPGAQQLLAVCLNYVRPGGRVGMLHYEWPRPPAKVGPNAIRPVAVVGVTTGYGGNMRTFSVFERAKL